VRDRIVAIKRPIFPILFERSIAMEGAEIEEGLGSRIGAAHAGLFQ